MRSPRAHRVGETIAGRYRLISPLGQGGYGAAFRAWDSAQGVPVVLKMPLAQHLDRPVILERFSREVARLRACSHPNIVPIIDDGQDDDGRPFIVMRFLPGGSLADRKKPVTLVTLHRWLPGIAAALDYIHIQGVLHRDVKPSNIFFDTQANAYLGDFGIARLIDEGDDNAPPTFSPPETTSGVAHDREESLTLTGQAMGTLPYMAPELFEERPQLTPKADQYSLGVALYELLSQSWPVGEKTREGFRRFHRSGQQSTPLSARIPSLPASLANAVSKALGKSPDDRFADCRAFAAAVLAEVPFAPLDPSHRRFLCPECKRLVRVPDDFGGRSCRCPGCNVTLRVTHDLNALWRPSEDPRSLAIETPVNGSFESHESLRGVRRDPVTFSPIEQLLAKVTDEHQKVANQEPADFFDHLAQNLEEIAPPAGILEPTKVVIQRRKGGIAWFLFGVSFAIWIVTAVAVLAFAAGLGPSAVADIVADIFTTAATGIFVIVMTLLGVTVLVSLPFFVLWLLGRL